MELKASGQLRVVVDRRHEGVTPWTRQLEPSLYIEVRNPTVVMSVRLDAETARAVAGLARAKGRTVSEILREAATAYAAIGGELDALTVELQGARLAFRMGTRNATTSARGLTEGSGEHSFGEALWDTGVLVGVR